MSIKTKKETPVFKVGDKFKHTEFGTIYSISQKTENTYTLKYDDDESKPGTKMGGEHIQQMITFQRWKKMN